MVSHATGKEVRFSCKVCSSKLYAELGHVTTTLRPQGFKAIYNDMFIKPNHGPGGTIRKQFAPTCHIFYTSGNTNVTDGLYKYMDFPAEFGGSNRKVEDVYHTGIRSTKTKRAPGETVFTEAEVAENNSETDTYIILHDLVLNPDRDFLKDHPGGPDVINEVAGRDATEVFENTGHSRKARDWANHFIIGYKEGASEEAKKRMKVPPKATKEESDSCLGSLLPVLGLIAVSAAAFSFLKLRK